MKGRVVGNVEQQALPRNGGERSGQPVIGVKRGRSLGHGRLLTVQSAS
ncbi:MAG: hypothetical protein M0020_10010 [Actinomycetota bacterium]|nr:hypothetical protein [Actinomycetota bacterium]